MTIAQVGKYVILKSASTEIAFSCHSYDNAASNPHNQECQVLFK